MRAVARKRRPSHNAIVTLRAPLTVLTATHVAGDRLALTFSDGTGGEADLSPLFDIRGLFALRDPAVFPTAFVDLGTVCWPGGLDVAAERLYAIVHGLNAPTTLEEARANAAAVAQRQQRG